MAKKITDTEGAAEAVRPADVQEANKSGFYMYIGPNIRGSIQTGTIYRGDRAQALERAASAVRLYPLVKSLIVSGDALPQARQKAKTPGNALYANYQKLAGK